MIINHNLSAINTYNRFKNNNVSASKAINRLSSGLRINSAADDAAGATISQKMRAQIRGLQQAERNIQDGISLIQTADSGLANIMDPNLLRLRELSVQAGNETLSQLDIENIQQEINEILSGIDDIANNTEFNEIHLLNGSAPPSKGNITSSEEIPFDYKGVLKLPSVNSNGQLNLFTDKGYPTTADDDDKRLVFGNGGTSWPSVIVDGENYYFQGVMPNPEGTAISITKNSIEDNCYNTVYKIANSNKDIDLEVTQSISVVADKYEIKYDIKNNSESTSKVGFQFNLDTDVADDDAAKFLVNDLPVDKEAVYSTSNGNIPDYFNVYNENGSTNKIQACGILKTQTNPYNSDIKYEVIEEPSKFGIGQWHNGIEKNNWSPVNNSYGDSAYSIWWDEEDLKNGETRSVNTFYGLSVPPTIIKPDPVVLDGPYDIKLQVGANEGNMFNVRLSDVRTKELFQDGLSVINKNDCKKAIRYIDIAMEKVSNERTKYGVYENALDHIKSNVSNYALNATSAESRIADVDMSKETLEYTKYNMLSQASQALLAQTKDIPQRVLELFREGNKAQV